MAPLLLPSSWWPRSYDDDDDDDKNGPSEPAVLMANGAGIRVGGGSAKQRLAGSRRRTTWIVIVFSLLLGSLLTHAAYRLLLSPQREVVIGRLQSLPLSPVPVASSAPPAADNAAVPRLRRSSSNSSFDAVLRALPPGIAEAVMQMRKKRAQEKERQARAASQQQRREGGAAAVDGEDAESGRPSCPLAFSFSDLVDRSVNVSAAWEPLVRQYLRPWLPDAMPLFQSAELLTPQMSTRYIASHSINYIGRFIISRWQRDAESGVWSRRQGKATMQWMGLPCNGTDPGHSLPIHDTRIRAWWFLFQYLIATTPEQDWPDYLDLLVWLHDAPSARRNEFNRSLTPPILSNCGSPLTVNVPYIFQHQLIRKPVEPLVRQAIDHICGACPEEAPLPCGAAHRPVDRAVWRGSTTGWRYRPGNWRRAKRSALVLLSREQQQDIDARFTRCSMCVNGTAVVMKQELGDWFGAPAFSFEDYLSMTALIDIDGNAWSSRFYELLATGTPVLKIFQHIRYPLLEEGRHFVLIQPDLSNLLSAVKELKQDRRRAQQIGHNAMRFVATFLRTESWRAYAVMMLRALSAITVKPYTASGAEIYAQAERDGLLGITCPYVSDAWCECRDRIKK